MEFKKHVFKVSPYLELPAGLKALHEIEGICENRLKLYRALQESNQKFEPYSFEWNKYIVKTKLTDQEEKPLFEFLLLFNIRTLETIYDLSDIRSMESHRIKVSILRQYFEDDISGHFLMALVCSKEKRLKSFFLKMETMWFRMRFEHNIQSKYVNEFLGFYGIKLTESSMSEKTAIKSDFVRVYGTNELLFNETTVYKIDFSEAPSMLQNRDVVLKNGHIYFPVEFVGKYLEQFLKKQWTYRVNKLEHGLPELDERLQSLVDNVLPALKKCSYFKGQCNIGILTIENINAHAKTFFPLCAAQLHKFLKEDNHLKHECRRQYGIFLKNAGMAYDEAIEYLETEFNKKIKEGEFKKKRYHYYFSYYFGMVARKIDFQPQSCDSIINNAPTGKLKHGCPFAHYDKEHLTTVLKEYDITNSTVSEIINLTKSKRYKEACTLYLWEKNGKNLDILDSPNAYYCSAIENSDTDIVDIEDLFLDEPDDLF